MTEPSIKTRSRRPNGDGSQRRRVDGRWEIRYLGTDGKHVSKILPRTTPEEIVTQTRIKLLAARDGGEQTIRGTAKLGAYATRWADTLDVDRLGPGSIATYRSRAAMIAADPQLARIKIGELTSSDLRAYLARRRTKRAAATVRVDLVVLGLILDAAVDDKLAASNVSRRVKAPRVPRRPTTAPVGDDLLALRAVIADDELRALWTLALDTGMRQGEILGLRWQDVDLEIRRITVRGTLRPGTSTRSDNPKHSLKSRPVPFGPRVYDALVAHKTAAGTTPHPAAWIFHRPDGRPLHCELVRKRWRAVCHRAGVREYRFHDLRHVAAAWLVDVNPNLERVAAYLGHTVRVLTDVYVNAAPDGLILPGDELPNPTQNLTQTGADISR